MLTEVFFDYSGYIGEMVHLDKLSYPFQFLLAPSILLFIKSSLFPQKKSRKWIHYSVFFVVLLYMLTYYLQDEAFKYNFYIDDYGLDLTKLPESSGLVPAPITFLKYFHYLVFIHLLLYAVLISRIVFKKYSELSLKVFNREDSYINHYRNLWLYYILAILLFVVLLVKYYWIGDFLFSLYLTAIIYIISINISFKSLNRYFKNKPGGKYVGSSLTESEKEMILKKIKEVIEDEEFYCNSNASLNEIAKKVNTSRHKVSQVINEMLEKSFFELLAEHRITRSKVLLSDPRYKNLTIDEISFMVGYNSRSAFNRVFKLITGITPTEYRKQHSDTNI